MQNQPDQVQLEEFELVLDLKKPNSLGEHQSSGERKQAELEESKRIDD